MNDLQDDDSCVFEPPVIKLTPYDRSREAVRLLKEKRDELSLAPGNERRIVGLDHQIKKAEEQFQKEIRRSTDDTWRRLRDIDDWRSRDGRELRNASRRKVRSKPNEDLSHMTPEQKEERKREQRADANFVKRQEAKGVAASDIQAALVIRQQEREAKHHVIGEGVRKLQDDPAFGAF